MSAATKIIVRVLKTVVEEVEVCAVTRAEAEVAAQALPEVAAVLDSRYPGEDQPT